MSITDYIPKGKHGIFLNPRAGLFLSFQLNPSEIDFDKSPNYDEEPIVGYHTSHIFWSSNNPMKISFELFFDAKAQEQNVQLFSLGRIDVGVLGTRSILESFLYPAEVDLFQRIDGINSDNLKKLFNSNRFFAPPDIYFIFGLRWYKGKLLSSPIKEKSYDHNLVPQQLETDINIAVIEDGSFKKWNDTQRKSLAVAESANNAIELPFNLTL